MRLMGVAVLIVVLSILPTTSRAADAWHAIAVSTGACSVDTAIRVVYAPYVVCLDLSKTSASGDVVTIVNFSAPTSPTVVSSAGPSPSTATYGRPTALGVTSGEISVCGGAAGTGSTGCWCGYSTSFSSPSWTVTRDTNGAGASPIASYGVMSASPPGSKTFMVANSYYDGANTWLAGVPITVNSSFSAGSMSAAYGVGSLDSYRQFTGVKVASDYYVSFYNDQNTGTVKSVGNDGTTSNTHTTSACTGSTSTSAKIRQPFGHNAVNGIVVTYNGSSASYVCSQKKAGGTGVNQAIADVDVRTGVSFNPTGSALRAFLWTTTGLAYQGDALDVTSFAAASAYNIGSSVLSGATVRGVVNGAESAAGIDMDADADTVDNPIAFLSSGLAWWGTAAAASSGGACNRPIPSLSGSL